VQGAKEQRRKMMEWGKKNKLPPPPVFIPKRSGVVGIVGIAPLPRPFLQ
jgi:hypothetical protein